MPLPPSPAPGAAPAASHPVPEPQAALDGLPQSDAPAHWPLELAALSLVVPRALQPMVVVWDAEEILLHNDAAVRLLGAPPAMGRSLEQGGPGWAALASLLGAGRAASDRLLQHGGQAVHWSATPLHDDAGMAAGILLTGQVWPESVQPDDRAELLAAISHASPDVIFAKDRSGRLLFANPATLRLVGKPPDRVLGRRDDEFLDDPQAARHVMDNDQRIMASGQEEEIEEVVPDPDGSRRVWLSRKMPYRDAQGRVVGLLGVSRDITQRKQLEDELHRSREELQAILDSITDGLAVLDCSWRYTYFSEQGARMLGLRREDIVGRNFWELFPHARTTRFGAEYERVMATRQPAHFEDYYPEPLNMWVECRCYPSRDGISVFFRDVSERHAAEAALRSSESRLRRVFEVNPIGMVTGHADGRVVDANEAFLRIVQMTPQDVRDGRLRWDLITPPEYLALDEQAVRQSLAHGISAVYEKEYALPDGRRVPVMLAVARFPETEELLAFVIDISDRKRAEQALREADRRKDEFVATLAHELRNPMASIRTAAHLLKGGELPRERLVWCADLISRQSHTMGLLLDDLLDVSRITSGRLELRIQPMDLHAAVRAALETARPLIESKQHKVELDLQGEGLPLQADPLRIEQVLTNLLTNAAKYTDPGGRIRLSVRSERGPGAPTEQSSQDAQEVQEQAVIEVADTGIGIAPDALSAVFEMFRQVHTATHRSQGGLGIGLALTRGLVELHGGRIQATSAGPGTGSTFTVTLPLRSAAEASAPHVPSHGPMPVARWSGRGLPVLLADDNVDAAHALALVLQAHDCVVHVAHDGQEALALAASVSPAVALLDIGMPGLDGHEVARRLRAVPGGPGMRLLAITGWGQDSDRQRSHAAGFDAHLTKPVNPDDVIAWLSQAKPGRAET